MSFSRTNVENDRRFGVGRLSRSRSSSLEDSPRPAVRALSPSADNEDGLQADANTSEDMNADTATERSTKDTSSIVRPPMVSAWSSKSNRVSTSFGSFRPSTFTAAQNKSPSPTTATSSTMSPSAKSSNTPVATQAVSPPAASSVPLSLHDFTTPRLHSVSTVEPTAVSRQTSPASEGSREHVSIEEGADVLQASAHTGGSQKSTKRGEWRIPKYNNIPGPASQAQNAGSFLSFRAIGSTSSTKGTSESSASSSIPAFAADPSEQPIRSSSRGRTPAQNEVQRDAERNSPHPGDNVEAQDTMQSPPRQEPYPQLASYGSSPTGMSETRLMSAIIIEDLRFDDDLKLVELRLPLKHSQNGQLWVNAMDFCNTLQSGPSRIDGPAKVYAYRGPYRQYFLRVSADNEDNFAPANLLLDSKRVIRIYVEPIIPLAPRPILTSEVMREREVGYRSPHPESPRARHGASRESRRSNLGSPTQFNPNEQEQVLNTTSRRKRTREQTSLESMNERRTSRR